MSKEPESCKLLLSKRFHNEREIDSAVSDEHLDENSDVSDLTDNLKTQN